MSGGLFALFDDVAALTRLAAASVDDVGAAAGRASAKAAGVVIDDTAVTPQYVHGLAAQREVPIIRRIAVGSLRNKLVVIAKANGCARRSGEWTISIGGPVGIGRLGASWGRASRPPVSSAWRTPAGDSGVSA